MKKKKLNLISKIPNNSQIPKAFTLIEMVIAVTILSLILTVIISIYFQMQKLRTDIFAKSILIKNTNSLVEKLNLIMKNYTIDYEEYFNRRIVGCNGWNWWDNFTRNVDGYSGYCQDFTAYGNENSIDANTWNNVLYYCTSKWTSNYPDEKPDWQEDCEGNSPWDGVSGSSYIYYQEEDNLNSGSGCWQNVGWLWNGWGKKQSFWEYMLQFWDVKKNADAYLGCQWDDDDVDLWIWPVAVGDNLHVKELYLISKDKKRRIFIRRKLIAEEDFNHDGTIQTGEKLYKLQILKLRGFDIGSWHRLDQVGSTSNDGKIDTWACDKQEWFICYGDSIDPSWGLSGYKLPANVNDGWVDLTINDLTVQNFDLAIFPTIDPDLAWQDTWVQIYPYVRVRLTTQFYPTNYKKKLNPERLINYKMNLQTTFSVKPY